MKLHQKGKYGPPLSTSEAIIKLFIIAYRKGGGFLCMKGTETHKISSGFFKRDHLSNQSNDIYPISNFINHFRRYCQTSPQLFCPFGRLAWFLRDNPFFGHHRFAFFSNARLLVVLSFAKFRQNPGFLAHLFETPKSIFKRFAIPNPNSSHAFSLSKLVKIQSFQEVIKPQEAVRYSISDTETSRKLRT